MFEAVGHFTVVASSRLLRPDFSILCLAAMLPVRHVYVQCDCFES